MTTAPKHDCPCTCCPVGSCLCEAKPEPPYPTDSYTELGTPTGPWHASTLEHWNLVAANGRRNYAWIDLAGELR